MNRAWMVALAVVAACGTGAQHTDETLHAAAGVGTDTSGTKGEVRILGVNGAAFSSLTMNVSIAEVRANSTVVTNAIVTSKVELANPNQAWLLSTFTIPSGVEKLDVTVSLEDGGAFVKSGKGGEIRAGCSVIKLSVPVSLLKLRGHVVLHMDLANSMVIKGQVAEFVPNFAVHY